MKTTLECSERLRPNVELRIVERDEAGVMVGYWRGFWYPDRDAVMLYPVHNPNCYWRVPRVKHLINPRVIKFIVPKKPMALPDVREEIPPPIKRRFSPFPGKDAKPVLLVGQEEIEL